MDGAGFEQPNDEYQTVDWWADPEHLEAARRVAELHWTPVVAVLDTSCVRTGLAQQIKRGGLPPASLSTVQDGTIGLYMERETLEETCEKLPVFAEQLRVPVLELEKMFAEDWLPYIHVVALPPELRALDSRAAAVRELDPDDYPTAALAALLSPCILLTHNYKHFRPLGIREPTQGVNAVIAVIDIKVGESRLQAVAMVPTVPAVAAVAGVKWAVDRVGPLVWVVIGLIAVGVVVGYRRQPQEKKDTIKKVAAGTGRFLLEQYGEAATAVNQARHLLGSYVVPAPERRSPVAAVFRELAFASDSMSAQQLCDTVDGSVRPAVAPLRAYLHANKTDVFGEARRGSFVLGRRYYVRHSTAG